MSEMTSRERILAAINHQPLDRVPLDIWATSEVNAKLQKHFGEGVNVHETLHIDGIGHGGPIYVGPPAPRDSVEPVWGMETRPVQYETGVYQEQIHYPLAYAESIDDLEAFSWPTTELWDYAGLREQLAPQHPRQALLLGYMTIFYLHNQLRGLEQSLMDPMLEPAFTRHLLQRMSDYVYEHHRRIFEAADGLVDLTQVTDDYGSQTGPMISLATFREFYRPHIQRFIGLAREFDIKVLHHDDGSMRTFLPDLVEDGIDVLNPVQHNCPEMEMRPLKAEFGERLCFHGGVENQKVLPFGTVEDVRSEVRDCIDALASDGTGYILAPCHNLQAVTPVENIIAMYDEAFNYGRF